MVRIAGIDREISTLELMWMQADNEEKMMLAMDLMIKSRDIAGQTIELTADTDKGKYKVTISKEGS